MDLKSELADLYLLQCCARPMIRFLMAHSAGAAPLHRGENGLASCPAPESACRPQWPSWGSGCGKGEVGKHNRESNIKYRSTHAHMHALAHSQLYEAWSGYI